MYDDHSTQINFEPNVMLAKPQQHGNICDDEMIPTDSACNQKQKRSLWSYIANVSEKFFAHETKNTKYGGLSRVPLHFWNICSSGPIIKRRRAAIETRSRDNRTCDNGFHTATNQKNTTISRTKNGDHNRVQQRFCRQAPPNPKP